MVDDVLEFVLVTEFSRSEPQTAQFDDGGCGRVLVVAVWSLVVEISCAERWVVSAIKKSSCGRSTDDL